MLSVPHLPPSRARSLPELPKRPPMPNYPPPLPPMPNYPPPLPPMPTRPPPPPPKDIPSRSYTVPFSTTESNERTEKEEGSDSSHSTIKASRHPANSAWYSYHDLSVTTSSSIITRPSFCTSDVNLSSNMHFFDINKELPTGSDRFIERKAPLYLEMDSYKGPEQMVHPGSISEEEFRAWWRRPMLILSSSTGFRQQETAHLGLRQRFVIDRGVVSKAIRRGDPIAVNGQDEDLIKYFATWKIGVEGDRAIIQLNAITCQFRIVHPENEDWPACTISVENRLCHVAVPEDLKRWVPETQPATKKLHPALQPIQQFIRTFISPKGKERQQEAESSAAVHRRR